MLTNKFWELAEDTKGEWSLNSNWSPPPIWAAGLTLVGTESHCGTSEIENLDAKGTTLKDLVRVLCHRAVFCKEGHFLYYCPHRAQYMKAVKLFELLGAKKLYTFHHLNYLKRRNDYGKCDLWMLAITPEEFATLQLMRKENGAVDVSEPQQEAA